MLQATARLKSFLKASSDFYLFFMIPSAWNILHLPSSSSLPSELLLLPLLGSGVTYLLGQGPALNTSSLCGPFINALSHGVVMIWLFSQQACVLPEGWDFI